MATHDSVLTQGSPVVSQKVATQNKTMLPNHENQQFFRAANAKPVSFFHGPRVDQTNERPQTARDPGSPTEEPCSHPSARCQSPAPAQAPPKLKKIDPFWDSEARVTGNFAGLLVGEEGGGVKSTQKKVKETRAAFPGAVRPKKKKGNQKGPLRLTNLHTRRLCKWAYI